MRTDIAISGSHLTAARIFARLDALIGLPPPANRSTADLNRHIRKVLGVEARAA